MEQVEFQVDYSPAPIQCIHSSPIASGTAANHSEQSPEHPALIFTHGAGGTLAADGIANFSAGFATQLPIICFQGNMNLKSRVKMFSAVMGRYNSTSCLGGRSMGARAAVMAAEEETKYLILASYPLHTEKEMRDQILLDLPSSINVIFISGDADSMCDLERLEQVRRKMSCRTWRIVVQTADHGMNVKPKQGTREVGMKVGEVVAGWVRDRDDKRREGVVSWEDSEKKAVWSGWCSETERSTDSTLVQASGMQSDVPVRRSKNAAKSSKRALVGNLDDEAVSSRTRNKKKT